MTYYIVDKQPPEENNFIIEKVPEDLKSAFEEQFKGKILASGNSLMEVLVKFGEKDHLS